AMTIDPGNPNQLYLSGDSQYSRGANSPIHNQALSGRLFTLTVGSAANPNYPFTAATPASQAAIDAGLPEGVQLTADQALLGNVPDVSRSGAPPGAATDTTTNPTTNNGNNRQVAAGTYYYRFTFVDSTGVESNPSDVVGPVAVAAGTGGQGQAIKLSNLPQRSAGVRLNIYRTKANGSSYFLVG